MKLVITNSRKICYYW